MTFYQLNVLTNGRDWILIRFSNSMSSIYLGGGMFTQSTTVPLWISVIICKDRREKKRKWEREENQRKERKREGGRGKEGRLERKERVEERQEKRNEKRKKEKKKTWVLHHRGNYADKASLSWSPLMVSLVLDQDQENFFLVRNRLGPAGMRRPHNHQQFAKIPKWKVLCFLS